MPAEFIAFLTHLEYSSHPPTEIPGSATDVPIQFCLQQCWSHSEEDSDLIHTLILKGVAMWWWSHSEEDSDLIHTHTEGSSHVVVESL